MIKTYPNKNYYTSVHVYIKKILFFLVVNATLWFSYAQITPFTMTLTASPEICVGNGEITINIDNTQNDAEFELNFYLLPDTVTPIRTVNTVTATGSTLQVTEMGFASGNYQVDVIQTFGVETNSQSENTTINNNIEDLAYTRDLNFICNASEITVNVTAGNANTFELRETDGNTIVIPPQASNILSPVVPGDYIIFVNDVCGNTLTQAVTVTDNPSNYSFRRNGILNRFRLIDGPDNCDQFIHIEDLKYNSSETLPDFIFPIQILIEVENPLDPLNPTIITDIWTSNAQDRSSYPTPLYIGETYNYRITITDACGATASRLDTITETTTAFRLNDRDTPNCGQQYIVGDYYRVISPPYNITITDFPAGFNPNNYSTLSWSLSGGNYTSPNFSSISNFAIGNIDNPLPNGTYTMEITDTCGRSDTQSITIGTPLNLGLVVQRFYAGCTNDEGSFNMYVRNFNSGSAQAAQITSATLTAAPATYPNPIPEDVSFNITVNNNSAGRFAMNSLPAGLYTFEATTNCGTTEMIDVNIPEAEISYTPSTIILNCGSFSITNSLSSYLGDEVMLLQKYYPDADQWGHPITGALYTEGNILSSTLAIKLHNTNNSSGFQTFNGEATNVLSSGLMRVILQSRRYKNGGIFGTEVDCITVLETFNIPESGTILENYYVANCTSGNTELIVDVIGVDPLNFSLTELNGEPLSPVIDNGSNPVFSELAQGLYTVEITDGCFNTTNLQFSTDIVKPPIIKPDNLCDGENGGLFISGLSFLDIEWTKDSDPTVIATGNRLNFEPFVEATDAGIYYATLSYGINPNACLNQTVAFEIVNPQTQPNSGIGQNVNLIADSVSFLNLFDYLTPPYDNFGDWTEITSSGNLNNEIWNTNNLPLGTYQFEYTVPGLCTGNESTIVTINLLASVLAVDDTLDTCPNSAQTSVINVMDNDTFNGIPINQSLYNTEVITPDAQGILTINTNGTIDVAAGAVSGQTYTLEYSVYEIANPTINQDVGTVSISIITDTNAPVFNETLPTNITVECNAIPIAAILTANDNCGDATVTFSETQTPGSCTNEQIIVRNWIAEDLSGNQTLHTQTITVVDTTPPTIIVPASNQTVECDGNGNSIAFLLWLNNNAGASATDNCGVVTWSNNFSSLTDACGGNGSTTVTFTATDACGLTATTIATFTIQDTTPPTFNGILPTNITVNCDNIPAAPLLTAIDTCGNASVTLTEDTTPSTCANTYTLTRNWIATDVCGLSTNHTQIITVQDNTNPIISTEASDLNVECDGSGNITELNNWLLNNAGAIAYDNCGTITWSNDYSSLSDNCSETGTVTVTFTATDDCGLSAVTSATFTIQDTTPPIFNEILPINSIVECNAIPTAPLITASDNCGTALVDFVETVTPGPCTNAYTLTRNWTATDACGLTTTHTQNITVQDTTNPIIDIPPTNLTVECDGLGNVSDLNNWLSNNAGLIVSDNCSTTTIRSSLISTNNTCGETITYTYNFTASDTCGNQTSRKAMFIVEDTTPPIITTEATNLIVECNGSGNSNDLNAWLNNNGGAVASDNCGIITWSNDFSDFSSNCGVTGSATVTFTATDSCGFTATTSATFTIQDTTPPVFNSSLPADITVQCDAIPNAQTLTANDNCGNATVSFNETSASGSCENSFTLTRSWIATDACGLTATHTQIITVQDNAPPTFNEILPEDITVQCDAIPNAQTLTANDNCGNATVSFNETSASGSCENSFTLTRSWIATDACGLTATHTQIITVQDNAPPTFNEILPEDITVQCDAIPNAQTLTANDNCGNATVSFNETSASGSCANNYTLTRTWIATDDCGLTASHTQIITVQDNTPPTFNETLPEDITVQCDAIPNIQTLTANDNCGSATVSFNETSASGSCANNYTLTRTWIATDACGLTATHTQIITVQDNTPPTFNEILPEAITVQCDAIPNEQTLTANDNCGSATVSFNETSASGSCANNYTLTRTWIATDDCGLTASHTQIITVQDNTPPTFNETLPEDITVQCDAIPNIQTLTANDNCGSATVSFNETSASGSCENSFTLTRTWIATDACGLTATHTQIITVQDNTPPTFNEILPEDITVQCDAIPNAQTLTANDNCGNATVSFNETSASGSCENSFTLTRTWIATDACGLTATHTQIITVQDNTPPTFNEILPEDITVQCDAIPNAQTLTANDNCGSATVSFNETSASGSCENSFTLTRTWIATDACGLTATHTQIISVQDNTPPTFNEALPVDITVQCDATIPSAVSLSATDTCSDVTITFNESIENQTCENSYTIVRTWNAIDTCGNEQTHIQRLFIEDTKAPEFVTNLPEDLVVTLKGCDIENLPEPTTVEAIDNCGSVDISYTQTETPGNCEGKFTVTREWIATDSCGNTNTHTQTIHISCEINIYNAVSTSNNGNDNFFRIEGIDCYPNNHVKIFNRWGVIVYETRGYDNITNVFRGFSDGRATFNKDEELPSGTYFYIIEYESSTNTSNKEILNISGYLYLNSKN